MSTHSASSPARRGFCSKSRIISRREASASAPNAADLDRGRRVGNRADYQDLIRLSQMLNCVHFLAGYPVEPIDLHASIRHLDATFDALTLADKPIHAYSLGRRRNLDCLEMVRIARGVDEAALEKLAMAASAAFRIFSACTNRASSGVSTWSTRRFRVPA